MNESLNGVNPPFEGDQNPINPTTMPKNHEPQLGAIIMGANQTLEDAADAWLAEKVGGGEVTNTADAPETGATHPEAEQVATAIASALTNESTGEVPAKNNGQAENRSPKEPSIHARRKAEVVKFDQARQAEGEAKNAALIEFFSGHVARIKRLPVFASLNKEDREDLIQDIAIKVMRNADQFRDMGVGLAPWINRIAVNTALDLHRRRQAIRIDLIDPVGGPVGNALKIQPAPTNIERDILGTDMVMQALTKLKEISGVPGAAEIIFAIDIQGMSYEDYAELSGVKAGTVKSRLFRARRDLRDKVATELLSDHQDSF